MSDYSLLEMLFCDEMGLERLDVTHNPALQQLSCEKNRLKKLDLSRNPELRWLELDEGVQVRCSERQKRAIPALRKLFKIASHKKLADMDLWELDLAASSHNWDDGVKKLQSIVEHPRCDLGTALKIYWSGEPEELAEFATPKDAPKEEQAVVKLLRTIEARVAKKDFKTRSVAFEGARSRLVPAALCRKVAGEK